MNRPRLQAWSKLLAPDDQRRLLIAQPSILGCPIGPVPSGRHFFQLPPKSIEISESSHAQFCRTLGHRWGPRGQWGQGIEIGTNPWPSLIESRRAEGIRRLLQVAPNDSPLEMQSLPPTVAVVVQIRDEAMVGGQTKSPGVRARA